MKLIDAPIGIFRFNGELVLKTEYCSENKLSGKYIPDCYIVRTGEYFLGGAKTANELNNLDVEPVDFAKLLPTVTDTISRQAAISAICNACGKIDCDKMDKCDKLQLPPANNSEFPNSSDCISRQAAIDIIKGIDSHFVKYVEQLPSAQPEHIKGHWIRNGNWSEGAGMGESYGHYWKCDKCGHLEQGGWGECGCNYCSNCGSDNREVK